MSDKELTCQKCIDMDRMINAMREKWKLATNKKQVLILTITPEKWFTKKICQEFEVSEHLVRKAKKLRNEKGSRAKPDAKKGQ